MVDWLTGVRRARVSDCQGRTLQLAPSPAAKGPDQHCSVVGGVRCDWYGLVKRQPQDGSKCRWLGQGSAWWSVPGDSRSLPHTEPRQPFTKWCSLSRSQQSPANPSQSGAAFLVPSKATTPLFGFSAALDSLRRNTGIHYVSTFEIVWNTVFYGVSLMAV